MTEPAAGDRRFYTDDLHPTRPGLLMHGDTALDRDGRRRTVAAIVQVWRVVYEPLPEGEQLEGYRGEDDYALGDMVLAARADPRRRRHRPTREDT